MKNNVKNVRFNVIDSSDPKYVEVIATFEHKGNLKHKYIFINRSKNKKKADYIKEAEGKFNSVRDKKSPLLIALTSTLAVATLAFAGLFTYKMIAPGSGGDVPGPQPEPDPPDPPIPPTPGGDIKLELDEETAKSLSIEPLETKKGEDYTGTITIKEADQALDLSHSYIEINGEELIYNHDFTIEMKDNVNANRQYALNIKGRAIDSDLAIHMPCGSIDDFKIDTQAYEQLGDFTDVTNFSTCTNNKVMGLSMFMYNAYTDLVCKKFLTGEDTYSDSVELCYRDSIESKEGECYESYGYPKMYKYEGSKDFPTSESDTGINLVKNMTTDVDFSNFKFNEKMACYEQDDSSTDSYTFSVFKGEIVSISSSFVIPMEDMESNFSSNFTYEIKAPAPISESDYYDEDETNPQFVQSDEDWNQLLTLDDSQNIIFTQVDDRKNGNIRYKYNPDTYFCDMNGSNYYSKRGDKYYKTYFVDSRPPRIIEEEIEEKEYNQNSYDRFKEYFAKIRDHEDEFEYVASEQAYVSNTYNPDPDSKEPFIVQMEKFVSHDKKRYEIYLSFVGTDTSYYEMITPHGAPDILVPEPTV